MKKREALLVYHFFHPDDVVSARHFSDLAQGLKRRDWVVSVLTSNRFCRDRKGRISPRREMWEGIEIHRAWRPPLDQGKPLQRLLNSFWLQLLWLVKIGSMPTQDVIILGTDPQFAYFILPLVKLLRPKTKIAYWGFDLYPEAIMVDRPGLRGKLASLVRPLTRICYRHVDLMADLGVCMRRRLDAYGHRAARVTLVPWALIEPKKPLPPDPHTRKEMFGDAQFTFLYSGTIGRAHVFDEFFLLARELKRRGVRAALCFAGQGSRYDELVAMKGREDENVFFAGFAPEEQLQRRLTAADFHLLSLRKEWEGIVLPSKFFGSLAVGRPVIFAGAGDSAIRGWIEEHRLGFYLSAENVPQVADALEVLYKDRNALAELQQNAFTISRRVFSRETVCDKWDEALRRIVS